MLALSPQLVFFHSKIYGAFPHLFSFTTSSLPCFLISFRASRVPQRGRPDPRQLRPGGPGPAWGFYGDLTMGIAWDFGVSSPSRTDISPCHPTKHKGLHHLGTSIIQSKQPRQAAPKHLPWAGGAWNVWWHFQKRSELVNDDVNDDVTYTMRPEKITEPRSKWPWSRDVKR